MEGESGVHFLNLSYFFRILYETVFGVGNTGFGISGFLAFLGQLWILVTVLAVFVCLFAIFVIIYSTARIFQIRQEEAPLYATITQYDEHERLETSRWQYILTLIQGTNQSDWRQAIIEADIILDELLTRLGYVGTSVGEKLKQVSPTHFQTLNNAWEAHKVRNEIAHSGMAFELTDRLAYRTIANYEAVFREHEEL
ncbi:MAG: hypothetical protein QOE22_338 [Candidatus Parcubacteria bacterium]|jgi:hypothetical protein|nr:hypothetical protein [Candidatus Parcubacteria bacterium]